MNKKNEAPIGVFDSGLGGLSVVKTLRRLMPEENIIFFGDSARNPYGTKTKKQVQDYSFEIVKAFSKVPVKAVVIACNTATSAAAKELRKVFDFDIVGMEPALKPAAELKTPSKIAVWATDLTLREEKFSHLRKRFDADHDIVLVACPDLVQLVEHDQLQDKQLVDDTLKNYIEQSQGAEFIVLGCTHFLFFKKQLQALLKNTAQLIDGNEGTIRHLQALLKEKDLLASNQEGTLVIQNSDPAHEDLSWRLYEQLKEQNL